MDLDFYILSIEIHDGEQNSTINNSTIKTDATSYECMFRVPETSNNLMARVQIDAVNRCKDTSGMPCNCSVNIDKGMFITYYRASTVKYMHT